MDDANENLLLRWSRRKHLARQDAAAKPAPTGPAEPAELAVSEPPAAALTKATPPQEEVQSGAEPAVPADKEEAVRVEDLPDIESLNYDSDYSVFLRDGVPEILKRQALRKLWMSNPLLANLDGLNDYDPKSMTFLIQNMEGAAEAVAEVGRGMRDKIMEAKRAREDRPRGRRTPPSQRKRVQAAEKPVQENSAGDAEEIGDEAGPTDTKHYDA